MKIKNGNIAGKITLLIILSINMFSQTTDGGYTPGRVFDTIYDRFGTKYTLDQIRIPESGTPPIESQITCGNPNNGFNFILHFEPGSGFEGSSQKLAIIK